MTPPWRSGMAQGLALQVMVRAHRHTDDQGYLETGRVLLRAFFAEVREGGVTYRSPEKGWWYEEYADEGGKESRVLNGMMYALLGIYEYYNYTEDADAKYLFDQGVLALKSNLADYDNHGYSFYDALGNTVTKYHKVHVDLLSDLYDITGEELFESYSQRWGEHDSPPREAKPPFLIRLITKPTKTGFAVLLGNFVLVFLTLKVSMLAIGRRKEKGP